MKNTNFAGPTFALAALISLLMPGECYAAKKAVSGQEVFKQYCVTCHVAGGNIVKPAKSIVDSKRLGTFALFKDYLNSPTGHMPHYQNLCKNDKMLKSLYKYVKTLESIKIKQAGAPRQGGGA